MNEHAGIVTFRGQPLTLLGRIACIGEAAPEFTALANDLSEVGLSAYRGKIVVVSCVPSLDTPVCDLQTRRFNKEAVELGDDVVILTISMDLPFAQSRWCGAAGITAVKTLSDHRNAEFGRAYGVLIKELRLLARAVFVIDREGVIRYTQIVKEITEEPDYGAAVLAIRNLA
ncbi:MAG: thiol peroxidase [Planctomycetes bacterium]|nr:thiol peroxidase [Planctomycetota bacterium]